MHALIKRKLNIFVIAVVAVAAVVLATPAITKAFFDESTAVTIDPSSIEDSTLIIGTHLIYLYALNDEIYAIAQDSASDSGQSNIYYKSELADGTWFDITDAGSISDITDTGLQVSDDTIAALYFTHHTKSDGITYDLRTNQAVCVFDINDAYDLSEMSALDEISLQYDTLVESGASSDEDKNNISLLGQLFSLNVQTAETAVLDSSLASLQSCYVQLAASGADTASINALMDVMAKIDNSRRELVYIQTESALETLMDSVTANGYNDALLTAIGDSQMELSDSLIEAESNLLDEGSTILSKKEYDLDYSLISAASGGDITSCKSIIADLVTLSNISNELIVSKTAEITMLEELLTKAEEKYKSALQTGPSEEYQAAVAAGSSNGVLDNIIKSDLADVNSARSELEFLVEAKVIRLSDDDAISYLKNELSQIYVYTRVIPSGDYKTSLNSSVEGYQTWLTDQLSDVKDSAGSTSGSSLYEQKEALIEERLEALDNEDLDLAKLLEAKIETLDEQIAAVEKASSDELKTLQEQLSSVNEQIEANPDDTTLLIEKADLEAKISDITTSLSDESAAASIQEMKNNVLTSVSGGDTDSTTLSDIETGVDGLGSMLDAGSSLALSALKEIYKKMVAASYLDDNSAYDSLISKIEDLVAESDVLEIQESGMSQDTALSVIEDVLGGSISVSGVNTGSTGEGSSESGTDGESDITSESGTGNAQVTVDGLEEEDVLAAMLALGDYAESTNNKDLASLAAGMAASLTRSGDICVFETHKSGGVLFAPADMLAQFCGYRYLWNATRKTAILSKGRNHFTFTAFYSGVDTGADKLEYMDTEAEFGATVYIPASYVSSKFGCSILSISGTDYSVLVNDKVTDLSEDLLEALLEKGEG